MLNERDRYSMCHVNSEIPPQPQLRAYFCARQLPESLAGPAQTSIPLSKATSVPQRPVYSINHFFKMSGVQFTALVRVPFLRGDFEDPQQVSFPSTSPITPHSSSDALGQLGRI